MPLTTSLLLISAGYMLVAGLTAMTVACVAKTSTNRFVYGSYALACFGGFAHQFISVLYASSQLVTESVWLLTWQADAASLAILSAIVCIYCDVHRGGRIDKPVLPLVLTLGFILVANHASPFSLHFVNVEHISSSLSGWGQVFHIVGEAGIASYLWHGLMLTLLGLIIFLILKVRSVRALMRNWVLIGTVSIMMLGVLDSLLIGLGYLSPPYLIGYAINVFVGVVAVDMILKSARRSQELVKRDMQMQTEVVQRRKVEDKLQRLSQVFMQAPSPVHIVDNTGKTIQVNEESIRFLRRDVSQAPRVNFIDMFGFLGLDRRLLIAALADGKVKDYGPYYFSAGVPVDALYLVRDAYLQFKVYPIFDQGRQLQEFVVQMEDVTEKQFVENAIESISSAVSAETGHVFFNHLVVQLANLLNIKYVYIGLKKDIDGRAHIETLAVAVDGKLSENFCFAIEGTPAELALREGMFAESSRVQEQFGDRSIIQDLGVQSYLGAAIKDARQSAIGVLATMDAKPMEHIKRCQEIVNIFVTRAGTELQRLASEDVIRKMAYEDHLTGLPNRTRLNEHVTALLERANPQTSPEKFLFVQVDLDHFKTINDALGHDIGDQVIRRLARRLSNMMQENLFIARIGGDEFAIVVSDIKVSSHKALEDTVRLIITMMERPVRVGDHLLDIGCTLGVVLFPDYAQTTIDVFRNADTALHKAKAAGRGSYQIFTPEMRNAVTKRLEVEKGLRSALQKKEFQLYYQAQIDHAGTLVGAEALIRWIHPEQGMVPPVAFIPVAEETGLITSIGTWVMREALMARKRWTSKKIPFAGHLSVNVSAWQFNRPDFVRTVIELISQTRVPPSHIVLEVTETALLNDVEETISKLSDLRRFGVSIALDDFGTGYSSLAYLRDLPIDIVKIDKTFVDVLETHAHEPLVESMIAIGQHMGLSVVAEGVESRVQLERLKAMGCHKFQGYYFSKPLPEAEFVEWLRERGANMPDS